MSEHGGERSAAAIRRAWSGETLDADARERVDQAIEARRRVRGRRRRLRLASIGASIVVLTAVAGAGLIGGDGSEARPVGQRAAAALTPGKGGLRYFARVRRTQDPLRSSTIEADIAYGGRRTRVVERDAAGRVFTKAVTVRGRTTLYIRGERRPIRVPPTVEVAPSFLDAKGLDELRQALPDSLVSGPMNARGRRVYELSWIEAGEGEVWRHELTVDARTFAPVRHERTLIRAPAHFVRPRPGARVTTVFERFERLP